METTGRYLVVLNRNNPDEARVRLQSVTGAMADSREFTSPSVMLAALAEPKGMILDRVGIAITTLDQDQHVSLQSIDSGILTIEPERYKYAIGSNEYLGAFRDGVEAVVSASQRQSASTFAQSSVQTYDESKVTWGLQACLVPDSRFTGSGIRVAVLDTGLDFNHPDFKNRGVIVSQSFA